MKLVVSGIANREIAAATQWLEDREPGLGTMFTAAMRRVFASIKENPLQFGPAPGFSHDEQVRIGLVKPFNYLVYFVTKETAQEVLIAAIHHGNRKPLRWADRLDQLDE